MKSFRRMKIKQRKKILIYKFYISTIIYTTVYKSIVILNNLFYPLFFYYKINNKTFLII